MPHAHSEDAQIPVALSIADGATQGLRRLFNLLVDETRRFGGNELARSLAMKAKREASRTVTPDGKFQLVSITPGPLAGKAF